MTFTAVLQDVPGALSFGRYRVCALSRILECTESGICMKDTSIICYSLVEQTLEIFDRWLPCALLVPLWRMALKQSDGRHPTYVLGRFGGGHVPSFLFSFSCFPSHLLPSTVIQCFNLFNSCPSVLLCSRLVADFLKINAVESKRSPQRGAMRDEEDRYCVGALGPTDPNACRYHPRWPPPPAV